MLGEITRSSRISYEVIYIVFSYIRLILQGISSFHLLRLKVLFAFLLPAKLSTFSELLIFIRFVVPMFGERYKLGYIFFSFKLCLLLWLLVTSDRFHLIPKHKMNYLLGWRSG
jgi:hypothetical protein